MECTADLLAMIVTVFVIGGTFLFLVAYLFFTWGFNTAMREEYPDLPLEETKE